MDSYTWTHLFLTDKQKLIFIDTVQTLDAVYRTCLEQWPLKTDEKWATVKGIRAVSTMMMIMMKQLADSMLKWLCFLKNKKKE